MGQYVCIVPNVATSGETRCSRFHGSFTGIPPIVFAIRFSRYSCAVQVSARARARDGIIVKGLIKRNKEIKRRRYPWHATQVATKNGASRSASRIELSISRFPLAISARREPEVGAHGSFPAWPSVRARTAD